MSVSECITQVEDKKCDFILFTLEIMKFEDILCQLDNDPVMGQKGRVTKALFSHLI